MKNSRLIVDIAAAGILTSVLHGQAIENVWYWSFWWMDILTHFLGGLFVGLIALWVTTQLKKSFSKKELLLFVLSFTLIVGAGWEIFEHFAGVVLAEDPLPDLVLDLIMDTVGALAAYTYVVSLKKKR